MDADKYQIWSLAGLWLGSIGTIGTVTYALFGAAMKRWFNKPKLGLTISDKFPHCALVRRGETTESNSDLDIVEICASLVNSKNIALSIVG